MRSRSPWPFYWWSIVLLVILAGAVALDWVAWLSGGLPDRLPKTLAASARGQTMVTLYFASRDATGVVPETRRIPAEKTEAALAARLVEALIAGPHDQRLQRTIPPGTRLLSLTIANQIAYVNFSQEIRSHHWGGSAGELITTASIVNTLTQLPGIRAVQLELDGRRVESIWGHGDTSRPIQRMDDLIIPPPGSPGPDATQ
ncbi:MAG: GerMN domain-containing protein [Firmicutes bacterium]|nr:GerMN domain-containing protein [Bacillota bacterium]